MQQYLSDSYREKTYKFSIISKLSLTSEINITIAIL